MAHFSTDPIIPDQQQGAHSDTVAVKELPDERTAIFYFQKLCERLQDLNSWKKYTGTFTADFCLCDRSGNEKQPPVAIDDHFRIDGPGPGSVAGEGFDWVQVLKTGRIEKPGEEEFYIRVHPVPNPKNQNKDIAHFFTDESTSSFIARRMGNKVMAEVHGRNETPNIAAGNLFDKARNAAAGAVAAVFYSKYQWKSLVDGLLNFETGETDD